jgi:hypothetical protein
VKRPIAVAVVSGMLALLTAAATHAPAGPVGEAHRDVRIVAGPPGSPPVTRHDVIWQNETCPPLCE